MPWDRIYVDHIFLDSGQASMTVNGAMWQDSSGNILARSGGATKNLSDIGTGGNGGGTTYTAGTGILITGTSISLNGNNLPTLRPLDFFSALGIPSDPWNFAYITFLTLTSNQSPGTPANGLMWQDTSGNVRVRSGGTTRNLSDIGTGGSLDSNNMPTLTPASSGNDLGLSARPWDALYVDHIYLHAGEGNSSTSGAMWQNSSGHIIVRSGGAYRNLSEIGTGGGNGAVTLVGGNGILVSGYTISLDRTQMPSLYPASTGNVIGNSNNYWDRLYVDHIYLHAGEGASVSANGAMWQGSGGNIYARSGGATKNLSDIGGGSGGSYVGGEGILVSGNTVSLDKNNMPALASASPTNFIRGFERLYVEFLFLDQSTFQNPFSTNGVIWLGPDNHVYVRTNNQTKDLTDI